CGQFLLLGVIHLDDVTVNRHLAEICTHVLSPKLRHLVLDEPPLLLGDAELDADRSCAFSHWIFASSNYNGHFKRKTWYCAKNFSEHETSFTLQRTVSSKNLVPAQKNFLSLYNGHFLREKQGSA